MKNCEICNKKFYVIPSRHMAKYCSNECRFEASKEYLCSPRKSEKEKKRWTNRKSEIEETQQNVRGIFSYDEVCVVW